MEITLNCFHETKLPDETYRFKWTVKNVSNLPEGIKIPSEIFYVESGIGWYAEFIKYSSGLDIKLVRKLHSSEIKVVSEVKILDCNGKLYYENTVNGYRKDSYDYVNFVFPSTNTSVLNELKLAPNDMWCFIFIIKIYDISTESKYEIGSQQMYEKKTKNSLCSNSRKMFENKIGIDVTLLVQNNKIEAHKLVLSAQSPVFAKMFETPMTESEKNTVVIKDVSVAAMTLLINFMYSKVEIGFSFEMAMELYYAADKYEVFDLRELCGKILLCKLAEHNAGMLLEMADKFKDGTLKSKIMAFINSNIKSCIKKHWWYELIGRKTELVQELMNSIK